MFLPFLANRSCKLDDLGHFKSDFVLDDFQERDVGGPHIANLRNQWPRERASPGSELANTP